MHPGKSVLHRLTPPISLVSNLIKKEQRRASFIFWREIRCVASRDMPQLELEKVERKYTSNSGLWLWGTPREDNNSSLRDMEDGMSSDTQSETPILVIQAIQASGSEL